MAFSTCSISLFIVLYTLTLGSCNGELKFRLQLFRCNIHKDAATQSWLVETGNSSHNIISLRHNPGKVLEAYSGQFGGYGLRIADRTYSPGQQFYYNTSKYMITSGFTGLCLAVPSGTGGVALALANCSDSDQNQGWSYDTMLGQMQYSQNWMLCMDAGTDIRYHDTGCGSKPYSGYGYCNYTLSPQARIDDLVGFIGVGEKAQLLSADERTNGGIGRLAVPAYTYGECLHGVRSSCGTAAPGSTGCPTSFPNPLGMAATFNRSLWSIVGDVIGTEGRALANQDIIGLGMWAPNVNLFRDPRWGRGQETPGEDPLLTSEYIAYFARHLQGDHDTGYLKIASTCKHFSAYDLENYATGSRKSFNAIVSDQDLVEYYWVPFRACVQRAHVQSIMCSYNAVNGIPSCANALFQNTIARGEWGFDGFFVSDCTAVEAIYNRQNYTSSLQLAIKAAMDAGTDVNCGPTYTHSLADAVNKGAVSESALNTSVSRLLTSAIRLGLLDPPERQPYLALSYRDVDTAYSRQISLEAARQMIVLLQNDGNILPLSTEMRIALIGPLANATSRLLGNYAGANDLVHSNSILLAIEKIIGIGNVTYAQGLENVSSTDTSGFQEAIAAASASDMTVVVVGLDTSQEDEAHDRSVLTLPGAQEELVNRVFTANPKTIVVLVNGGPLAIESIKDTIPAIIEAFYPGQLGANAIAEVLFGQVNPSGRLPFTVYPADFIKRKISDMSLRDNGGCTYQHYTGKALYEFGHGLSYSVFTYAWKNNTDNLVVHTTTAAAVENSPISYQVTVQNLGPIQGGDVVLGFIQAVDQADAPLKELFDFARVYLQIGESATVHLSVPPAVLSLVDKNGVQSVRAGRYRITVGDLVTTVSLAGPDVELFNLPDTKERHVSRSNKRL